MTMSREQRVEIWKFEEKSLRKTAFQRGLSQPERSERHLPLRVLRALRGENSPRMAQTASDTSDTNQKHTAENK